MGRVQVAWSGHLAPTATNGEANKGEEVCISPEIVGSSRLKWRATSREREIGNKVGSAAISSLGPLVCSRSLSALRRPLHGGQPASQPASVCAAGGARRVALPPPPPLSALPASAQGEVSIRAARGAAAS